MGHMTLRTGEGVLVVTAPAFNCFVDAVHPLPGRIFISAVGEIGLGMAVEAEPGKTEASSVI